MKLEFAVPLPTCLQYVEDEEKAHDKMLPIKVKDVRSLTSLYQGCRYVSGSACLSRRSDFCVYSSGDFITMQGRDASRDGRRLSFYGSGYNKALAIILLLIFFLEK